MSLTMDECERLEEILARLAENKNKLKPHELRFVEDQETRYDERAGDMRLSTAQWNWLNDLYERFQ